VGTSASRQRGFIVIQYEQLALGGTPVVGFGQEEPAPPTSSGSQWGMALTTSVVGAAAGWVIEEVARNFRRKYR